MDCASERMGHSNTYRPPGTIFDAVEFALTGTISKYGNVRAVGESVADYLWWTGADHAPNDHFVQVGFRDGSGHEISVRRARFADPDPHALAELSEKLCDPNLAPQSPLVQLCAASIIRDERIASLSLDLKESDRYALVRDALGANDADTWIGRAGQLVTIAKRRVAIAQQEVMTLNNELAAASRRIDEVRASFVAETVMGEAINRLRTFSESQLPPDQLAGTVRVSFGVQF
jgi:chromosome segregation protein